jgi:hypothetical protein
LSVSFGFFDWTCEFRNFTDAFGVGGVRARNKCSADFRSVPARFNAKEGCFGGSDVSVQEFLHCRSFVFIELLRAADALKWRRQRRSKIHGFDQLRTNHPAVIRRVGRVERSSLTVVESRKAGVLDAVSIGNRYRSWWISPTALYCASVLPKNSNHRHTALSMPRLRMGPAGFAV